MKFSIITCAYNSEKFIQRNLDSIREQTNRDFEHIFIDGMSSDKTIEILKKYQKKNPGQVLIYQSPAKGISNAMNIGIQKARGDYIIHLHSDDSLYQKQTLSKVANFIKKNNNPEWIYGKAKIVNDNGLFRIAPHRKIYQKARFCLLLLTNYIPHQAVFIKRNQFEINGLFDEKLKSVMDYEFWLRLTKNKVKSTFIDEIICNFFARADAQSAKPIGKTEDMALIETFVKNPLLVSFYKKIHQQNQKRDFFTPVSRKG